MRLINQFLGSTMTSNASKIIFVTGGTGFIGFHVLVQLLEAGYTVRATARGKKANLLRNALGTTYDKLQVLEIPDIFSDDLREALRGAYGIIHLASTTPGKADAATSYRVYIYRILCARPLYRTFVSSLQLKDPVTYCAKLSRLVLNV